MVIDPIQDAYIRSKPAAIQYYGYAKDQLLAMTIKDINILRSDKSFKKCFGQKSERRNYFQSHPPFG